MQPCVRAALGERRAFETFFSIVKKGLSGVGLCMCAYFPASLVASCCIRAEARHGALQVAVPVTQ